MEGLRCIGRRSPDEPEAGVWQALALSSVVAGVAGRWMARARKGEQAVAMTTTTARGRTARKNN